MLSKYQHYHTFILRIGSRDLFLASTACLPWTGRTSEWRTARRRPACSSTETSSPNLPPPSSTTQFPAKHFNCQNVPKIWNLIDPALKCMYYIYSILHFSLEGCLTAYSSSREILATFWREVFLQSGAAGWVKGFVTCFLEVPLACLGSMAAAVQPNGLGNS